MFLKEHWFDIGHHRNTPRFYFQMAGKKIPILLY